MEVILIHLTCELEFGPVLIGRRPWRADDNCHVCADVQADLQTELPTVCCASTTCCNETEIGSTHAKIQGRESVIDELVQYTCCRPTPVPSGLQDDVQSKQHHDDHAQHFVVFKSYTAEDHSTFKAFATPNASSTDMTVFKLFKALRIRVSRTAYKSVQSGTTSIDYIVPHNQSTITYGHSCRLITREFIHVPRTQFTHTLRRSSVLTAGGKKSQVPSLLLSFWSYRL